MNKCPNNDFIQERLDWYVCFDNWRKLYNTPIIEHGVFISSDHCPLILWLIKGPDNQDDLWILNLNLTSFGRMGAERWWRRLGMKMFFLTMLLLIFNAGQMCSGSLTLELSDLCLFKAIYKKFEKEDISSIQMGRCGWQNERNLGP
ncbi:hypothetical protein PanWU01x14_231620 [Parasponia andersonii]|uniref:Uncharacterized protein n=1 Tax=Parasponia andersonii TaxID=3476 RepID=A0A2P5BK82_PARAD|nr:hypothetical protein PanWU01x14_231620 [Parasponia andersonii]